MRKNDCDACRQMEVGERSDLGGCGPLERFRSGEREYKAGRTLVRAGDSPNSIYVMRSGWAYCELRLPNGKRHVIDFLLPGDWISLPAVLDPDRASTVTVRALTDVAVCEFSVEALASVRGTHEAVRRQIDATLLGRLELLEEKLGELACYRAHGRVAKFILDMRGRLAARAQLPVLEALDCPIKRELIADSLGLTVAHLNRTLADFERGGMIHVEGRQIYIRDAAALAALLD